VISILALLLLPGCAHQRALRAAEATASARPVLCDDGGAAAADALFSALVDGAGLPPEQAFVLACDGLVRAARRALPGGDVEAFRDGDCVVLSHFKEVAEVVEDSSMQVSMDYARRIAPAVAPGEEIEVRVGLALSDAGRRQLDLIAAGWTEPAASGLADLLAEGLALDSSLDARADTGAGGKLGG